MNNDNKQIAKISIFITSVFVIILSMSYAFITSIITGEKQVVINAGVLDLVLEEDNEITLENAYPMYDEVGMIQEDSYDFRLVNKTSNPTNYKIVLNKIEISDELSEDIVKYYLTKDGVGTPELLSTIADDYIIDEGTIEGSKTINYSLRLWIDSSVTGENSIKNKSLRYMLRADTSQKKEGLALGKYLNLDSKVDTTTEIDFSRVSSETNGRGIYKYTEDGEDIYYFRGAVENNHIIFGGYCWKMIRTTSTGGVKMIYNGVSVDGNCKKVGGELLYSTFNDGDNAYLGYMYGLTGVKKELSEPECIKLSSNGSKAIVGDETDELSCKESGGKWVTTAYDATHANVVNSKIKNTIDNWFSTSSLNTEENLSKIEDVVYCNDRSIDKTDGSLGYGNKTTYYGAYNRLNVNKTPSLECINQNDRFTVNSEIGNGSLTYPVGLITADEVALAGGVDGEMDSDFYLDLDVVMLLLSPSRYFSGGSYFASANFLIGSLTSSLHISNAAIDVRPVVSLKSTVKITDGDGTKEKPYIVE